MKYEVRFNDPKTFSERCITFEGKDAKEEALIYAEDLRDHWNVTVTVFCIKQEFIEAFLCRELNGSTNTS